MHKIFYKENSKGCVSVMQNNKNLSLEKILKNLKEALKIEKIKVHPSFRENKEIEFIFVGVGASSFLEEDIYSLKSEEKDFRRLLSSSSLIIVGEMRHHEILSFQEKGFTVLMTGHSESERFFLKFLKEDMEFYGYKNIKIANEADIFFFYNFYFYYIILFILYSYNIL